jgi:hypothetical protein
MEALDDKPELNMSLDEIIKKQKIEKQRTRYIVSI